ncbi:hypothetical protein E4T49_04773 [Aureobasidium sp. EXF-10728]|nr:hypothetical protein E4T49_04773 [Aureobasidium sp. EXF-10728]
MSEEKSEEPMTTSHRSDDESAIIPQVERRGPESHVPQLDEDALVLLNSRYGSRAEMIKSCLHQGAWNMTDEELNTIIHGIALGQNPSKQSSNSRSQQTPEIQDVTNTSQRLDDSQEINPEEVKAMTQCHREQNLRTEAARATRQLHRYHLVQRRYQELLHDDLQKDKPARPSSSLKRNAFEQVMRETKGQTDFPLYPTNVSTSQRIQNFAIKAQRKPYFDIGIWGFAILRLNYADDEAWDTYKTSVEEAAQKRLQGSDVPEHISSMFRFTYLEDATALSGPVDQVKLVKYWDQNKWDEHVHMHINRQFFLSADELEAREGENPNDPPMYLHDASVEGGEEGFPGFMRTSVYDLFLWHITGMEKSHLHLRTVWDTLNS